MSGTFVEICDCSVICPCWVNEHPDEGECTGVIAWAVESGTINGVDVAGRKVASLSRHDGDRATGGWQVVLFVDDGSTEEQQDVLVEAFTGRLGGALGEFAQLTDEVLAVERTRIEFEVDNANATLSVGDRVQATTTGLLGSNGCLTTLNESALATTLGSPAVVGKASKFNLRMPSEGFDQTLTDTSATRGSFSYRADATHQPTVSPHH